MQEIGYCFIGQHMPGFIFFLISSIWLKELTQILNIEEENVQDIKFYGSVKMSFQLTSDHKHDLGNGISLLQELAYFGKLMVNFKDQDFNVIGVQSNATQYFNPPRTTEKPVTKGNNAPTGAHIVKEDDKVIVKEEGSMTVYIIAGVGALLGIVCLCLLGAFLIRRQLSGSSSNAVRIFFCVVVQTSKQYI